MNILRVLTIFVIVVGLGPTQVSAHLHMGVKAEILYGWCRSFPNGLPTEPVGGMCAGYILGVIEAHGEKETIYGYRNCLPEKLNMRQLRSIIVNWLEQHPEKMYLLAHGVIAEALVQEFPCPKRIRPTFSN